MTFFTVSTMNMLIATGERKIKTDRKIRNPSKIVSSRHIATGKINF